MNDLNLECKRCGAEIPAEDLNRTQLTAFCRACWTVFDVSAQLRSRPEQQRRDPVPLPATITLERGAVEETAAGDPYRAPQRPALRPLVISQRWKGAERTRGTWVVLLPFGLILAGLPITIAILGSKPVLSAPIIVPSVFFVPFGLAVAYWSLAEGLNTTTITVRGGMLSIRIHPIPMPGSRTIAADRIDQLYCEQAEVMSKGTGPLYQYVVKAILKGQRRRIRLLDSLASSQEALFIEQQIEELLGIVDVEVPGQHVEDRNEPE